MTDADDVLTRFLTGIRELRESFPRPGFFAYSCTEDFVLKNGRAFTVAPLPLGVRPMRLQQCFDNAYRLAERTKAFHYVEGYAISVMPVPHAWCVTRDGEVVDPTWQNPPGTAYFGVELSLAELKLSRRGGCLSLLDDWKRQWPATQGVDVFPKDMWFKR